MLLGKKKHHKKDAAPSPLTPPSMETEDIDPLTVIFHQPLSEAARRSDPLWGAVPAPVRLAVDWLNKKGTNSHFFAWPVVDRFYSSSSGFRCIHPAVYQTFSNVSQLLLALNLQVSMKRVFTEFLDVPQPLQHTKLFSTAVRRPSFHSLPLFLRSPRSFMLHTLDSVGIYSNNSLATVSLALFFSSVSLLLSAFSPPCLGSFCLGTASLPLRSLFYLRCLKY